MVLNSGKSYFMCLGNNADDLFNIDDNKITMII